MRDKHSHDGVKLTRQADSEAQKCLENSVYSIDSKRGVFQIDQNGSQVRWMVSVKNLRSNTDWVQTLGRQPF